MWTPKGHPNPQFSFFNHISPHRQEPAQIFIFTVIGQLFVEFIFQILFTPQQSKYHLLKDQCNILFQEWSISIRYTGLWFIWMVCCDWACLCWFIGWPFYAVQLFYNFFYSPFIVLQHQAMTAIVQTSIPYTNTPLLK